MTEAKDNKSGPQRTRIERILEPLGARHGAGLIAFFEKVSSAEFDFVVFMARKALCIYRMMELCGVKKISVPVLSDALLDSDPNVFRGKRVLVVDDTLFVGTTLSDAKERLARHEPAALAFWVYCVDGDTWSDDTFQPDYIHETLTAQETIEFCAAECRAMINAAVPYLSDFAASRRIRLTPTQLSHAIKPVNWLFHDVSSQYHEQSKVKYYSAFPDQFINDVVRDAIGNSIFDLIDLAKIRAFATWTGGAYEVTFVPVITFAPTDRRSLQQAVKLICDAFNIDHKEFGQESVMTEMRLLQCLVGATYLRTYWESFDNVLSLSPDQKFAFEWSASIFSEKQAEIMSIAIAQLYRRELSIPKVSQYKSRMVKTEPEAARKETRDDISSFLEDYFSADDDIDFGHTPLSDLTAIFLEFQARFETAAQLEVKKEPNPKYRDRLKRGMAWRTLCAYLLSKYRRKNSDYHRNMMSLVLDRLIDFGIAVPIIAVSENRVYRAYRHGEDVKFGAQEESLVFNLLAGFQSGRGSDGIEATYLEKLIVILLRVGMDEEWLNLWYSHSGRDTLARVGYHLQGAVPISPRREDELVPEGDSSWLSRRLVKTGTLKKVPNPKRPGSLYVLGNRPEAGHLKADAQRTATMLGNTLGAACTFDSQPRSDDRPISAEDLIILTSCANAIDVTGAVAAELRIFCDWYDNQGSRILKASYSNPRSRGFLVPVMRSRGAESINSAGWKLTKYETQTIDAIVSKVQALGQRDSGWVVKEGVWDAVFNAFRRNPDDGDWRKLARFHETAQELVICFKFVLSALESIKTLARSVKDESARSNLSTLLSEAELPSVVPRPDLQSLANQIDGPHDSTTSLRKNLGTIAQSLNTYVMSLCALAGREAAAAESVILKSNRKLTRVQYSFMVWYDIIDVRGRKQGDPDSTDSYALATESFRREVNTLLSDAQIRIRAGRGDLMCDTGDIGSFDDGKHIFLNVRGGAIEEGNRLVCDIVHIAEQTGVKLRLLAVPTNLRGEYVYLNRGSTSIDGDYKSHVHTIIQSIEHHDVESVLEEGGCIVWLLDEMAKDFKNFGSVRFDKSATDKTKAIKVNIRGFRVENTVSYIKSVTN